MGCSPFGGVSALMWVHSHIALLLGSTFSSIGLLSVCCPFRSAPDPSWSTNLVVHSSFLFLSLCVPSPLIFPPPPRFLMFSQRYNQLGWQAQLCLVVGPQWSWLKAAVSRTRQPWASHTAHPPCLSLCVHMLQEVLTLSISVEKQTPVDTESSFSFLSHLLFFSSFRFSLFPSCPWEIHRGQVYWPHSIYRWMTNLYLLSWVLEETRYFSVLQTVDQSSNSRTILIQCH